ncbi:P22 phage major capsid protein family protein [Streptomyces abikoensis]|uniref:P22 phage major capsid protein family protein n=1 Tax=Streptomyces abikoensis TaxID=97398 RepID=UPI0037170EB6
MSTNIFVKADKLAAATLGLLQRQAVLAGLVAKDSGADFVGAAGDVVNIRRPSRLVGAEQDLRADNTGGIQSENLSEWKIPVRLDTHVYNALDLTDAELSLDVTDFGAQCLTPQADSIIDRIEKKLAAKLATAPGIGTVDVDKGTGDEITPGSVLKMIVKARTALNKQDVPVVGRVLLVGSDIDEALQNDEKLSRVDTSGTDGLLREATIGKLRGFTVVSTNRIPADMAIAFHPSAYILVNRAPVVPTSAQGSSSSFEGLSVRVMRDYNSHTASDRSFLSTYVGIGEILDAPEGTPKGQEATAAKQMRAVSFKLKPVTPPKPESK